MQIFAIAGIESDTDEQGLWERAAEAFGEANVYRLNDCRCLFVATGTAHTTGVVAKKAGVGGRKGQSAAVVMRLGHNAGYHEVDLWEWMKAVHENGE